MTTKKLILNTLVNLLMISIVCIIILYFRTSMEYDNPLLYLRGVTLGLALYWFTHLADKTILYGRRLYNIEAKM